MFDYLKRLFRFFQTEEDSYEDNLDEDEEKILSKINVQELDIEPVSKDTLYRSEPIGQGATEEVNVEIFKCVHRTGKITYICTDYGIIDNNLYFESSQVSSVFTLRENDEISFTTYKARANETERVYKIYGLKNDLWDNDEKSEFTNKNEEVEEIPALPRLVSGRIVKRKGRQFFIEQLNIWCDLDKVQASFVPIEGDWVSLEGLVTVNEEAVDLAGDILEVSSLKPLMEKSGVGRISLWSPVKGEGAIENLIYFTKIICSDGYVPNLGDEVIYNAIESDQESYKWRALSVIPNKIVQERNKFDSCFHNDLLADKNGISIHPFLCAIEMELHTCRTITFEVTNNMNFEQILTKSNFSSVKSKSQLVLKSPNLNDSFVIKPKDTIKYIFECKGKFLGLSCEMFVFHFKNFKIARRFEINITGSKEMNKLLPCKIDTVFNVTHDLKYIKNNVNAEIVLYGPKPWKPPKFRLGERKGVYKVPDKLWMIVGEDFPKKKTEIIKDLVEYATYLREDLNFTHYADRFHTLLYLEEMEIKRNFRRYDMNGTILLRNGEYLVVEVPGLVEERPSVIPGDKIILSQPWSESNNVQHIGYIHEIHQKSIYIKFHGSFHDSYDESECNIIFEPNVTPLMRCHDAVNRSLKKHGIKWLFPSSVNEKLPQVDFEIPEDAQNLTENVASFFKEISKGEKITTSPKGTEIDCVMNEKKGVCSNVITLEKLEEGKCLKGRKKLTWFNKNLNERQKMAVINVLKGQGRPLPYIIFGPPGTGKTITLVEVIMQIHRLIPESRLLITTPSNSSADLICERLIEFGNFKPGNLVRLMAFSKASEGNISLKLVPYSTVVDIKGDGAKDYNKISNTTNIQSSAMSQLVGRHKITVGTCVCIGSLHYLGFPPGHFTHILVDEAGQATEPELLISTTFQNFQNGQVVLTGDPQQLGPVCISSIAKQFGLGISLLQRFISVFPYTRDFVAFPRTSGYDPRFITKLNVNYRSVPEILALPSQLFYNSELIPKVSQKEGIEADIIQKFNFTTEGREKPAAIIFHGILGQNYQEEDSPSWYNPHEVWQVVSYLRQCYNIGLTSSDVGILTPYSKQVQKLSCLLRALNLSIPKIGTVENFQGQERHVIIISTVRSSICNLKRDIIHYLGFVASPRRLNVSLTRARALVIILGNPILLSKDPYWKNVIEYCVKNKSYTGCSLNQFETDEIAGEK